MKKFLFLIFALLMLSARLPAQHRVTATLSAAASNCLTTNVCQALATPNMGSVTFTVSANASGNTIQFEATANGGTTWVALNATPSNSTTAATSTTSTGTWQANVAAYTSVRLRMSTLAGGTTTVTISTSPVSARSGGGGGGSGTVTSIATTSPITGGTITTTGTIACATCVTSAASLTSNAVMIGGGSQASSTISADTTTTHALFATAGVPAFRALATTDLPITTTCATANGLLEWLTATTQQCSADFTIDATAHTLLSGASGLVDFSAITTTNGFKIPVKAGCTESPNGAMCFDSTNGNVHISCCGGTGILWGSGTGLIAAGAILKSFGTSTALLQASALSDTGTVISSTEPIKATAYQTATNCAANGTAANPSVVSCSSAAAGMFSCATNASTGTCTVNTTAVTANSEISITQDAADGGASQLNVTCNTGNVLSATAPLLSAKVAATSFTINLGTVTTNPACFEYIIKN